MSCHKFMNYINPISHGRLLKTFNHWSNAWEQSRKKVWKFWAEIKKLYYSVKYPMVLMCKVTKWETCWTNLWHKGANDTPYIMCQGCLCIYSHTIWLGIQIHKSLSLFWIVFYSLVFRKIFLSCSQFTNKKGKLICLPWPTSLSVSTIPQINTVSGP